MAFSVPIVTTSKLNADTTSVTTDAINTSTADFIVLCVSAVGNFGANTVSDNKSNSWNALTYRGSGTAGIQFYWSVPTTVGSGHTFQVTTSGNSSYPSICVAAFSGGKQTAPNDQQNGADGAGNPTVSSGSITPSEDNCLIVSAVSASSGSTPAVDSGMTVIETEDGFIGSALAYKIQTTAAAINAGWSGGSFYWGAAIASFKAAAASAGPTLAVVANN